MIIADLFTPTKTGFSTFVSDLEGNLTGSFSLQSGKSFANVDEFLGACRKVYSDDLDNELQYWEYKTDAGKIVTIFNT